MTQATPIRNRATSTFLALMAAGAAAALAWQSVKINLARSCMLGDAPYLAVCPGVAGNEQRMADLRARISTNPGDSGAYIQLGLLDTPAQRPRWIDAASRLAPSDPNVLVMVAAAALDRKDWRAAISPLVALTEHRSHNHAAVVLAGLIAGGQEHLLHAYVLPGTHWLERVLAQVPQAQGSFSKALPLAALALERQILDPEALAKYINQLKAAGAWADAYSLWVVLHGGATPVLYNGGFDQPFRGDGFDWEVTSQAPASRAGASVDRTAADQRGAVLDVRFTGRAIPAPLIKQPLFVGPGRYVLRGEYKATQLRLEQGLAWSVRCAGAATPAGKSPGLMETRGAWQPFEFEFSIPADCGLVAELHLETFAPFEAAVGSKGRASFDALTLQKVERQ